MKLIKLTKGQVAKVDDEDFEWLNQWKWHANWNKNNRSFYAMANIKDEEGRYRHKQMHRLILSAQEGEQVDHINHDTLDNRRSQIRLCNGSQNQQNKNKQRNNTSGYKGVSWNKGRKMWQAAIGLNRKLFHLGYFKTPEEASETYIKKSKEFQD